MRSADRYNMILQCRDFLERVGVEAADYYGLDELESLMLQCLSMFDPSALDQDMTEGLAALRAKRDAASGVTGEWTVLDEGGKACK